MKTIYVYDKNTVGGLSHFYDELGERGASVVHCDKLSWIEGEGKKIIINPICSTYKEHFDDIRDYAINNPKNEIYLIAPSLSLVEIKKLLGEQPNIKNVVTKEDWARMRMADKLYGVLEELVA
jgi:hypothetical protein